jgi:hypothetical protein
MREAKKSLVKRVGREIVVFDNNEKFVSMGLMGFQLSKLKQRRL